jgi:hypothetical protein
MAKVILEFDPIEDRTEMESAINGSKWKAAIWDLDQELRKTTKYGHSVVNENEEATDIEYDIAEKYRQMLRDIISEMGLSLND